MNRKRLTMLKPEINLVVEFKDYAGKILYTWDTKSPSIIRYDIRKAGLYHIQDVNQTTNAIHEEFATWLRGLYAEDKLR